MELFDTSTWRADVSPLIELSVNFVEATHSDS